MVQVVLPIAPILPILTLKKVFVSGVQFCALFCTKTCHFFAFCSIFPLFLTFCSFFRLFLIFFDVFSTPTPIFSPKKRVTKIPFTPIFSPKTNPISLLLLALDPNIEKLDNSVIIRYCPKGSGLNSAPPLYLQPAQPPGRTEHCT